MRCWVEVAVADLGLGPHGREFVRFPAGVVWRYDAHLAGAAVSGSDYDELVASMEALLVMSTRMRAPLDVVSDVRRTVLAIDNAAVLMAARDHFGPLAAAYAPLLRRQAGLIPNNWASPFWTAINTGSGAPWQVETFFEPAPLWSWLGTDPAVAAEIDALVAEVLATPDLLAALVTLLRAEPGIDLTQAARRLGRSTRSLQRALATSGQTFATLRSRIRQERAQSLLANPKLKVEAIASVIGFASSTPFTSWFRRVHGVTPSQFREGATRL